MRAAMEPTVIFGSWLGLDAVLSIQKSPGSQPGAQINKSDECYQHTFSRVMRSAHNQSRRARSWGSNPSVDGLARFLLESLILAQDERWRRA